MFSHLPTPFLVADLPTIRDNLEWANRLSGDIPIRPHFKAHKCPDLMHIQLGAHGHGATCQTVHEAAALARTGVGDILVSNEVADAVALRDVAALAEGRRLGLAVDCRAQLSMLAAALVPSSAEVDVYIEIEVGSNRCGVDPTSETFVNLVKAAMRTPSVRLVGLQAFARDTEHTVDETVRRGEVAAVADTIARARDTFAAEAGHVPIVTGGGSGTLGHWSPDTLDEVQAGSYVLADADYLAVGRGYRTAAYVVSTVVSVRADHVVLDAGAKAVSAGRAPVPVTGLGHVTRWSDEHAEVTLHGDASRPRVGDRVLVVPGHIDPTCNLHAEMWVLDGNDVRGWRLTGRRGEPPDHRLLTTVDNLSRVGGAGAAMGAEK